jgi:hypothetical protein
MACQIACHNSEPKDQISGADGAEQFGIFSHNSEPSY